MKNCQKHLRISGSEKNVVSDEEHYETVNAVNAVRHLGSPLEEDPNIEGRNNRQAAQCLHGEYAMLDENTMEVNISSNYIITTNKSKKKYVPIQRSLGSAMIPPAQAFNFGFPGKSSLSE